MGDCNHCTAFEILSYRFKDGLFCDVIDAGSGLVHEDDLVFVQDGPCNADQLLLART